MNRRHKPGAPWRDHSCCARRRTTIGGVKLSETTVCSVETPDRIAQPAGENASRDAGDILTIGFGAAVAMWGVGYVCRLPGALVPPWLILGLMLGLLLAGGWVAGRFTDRGWRGGLYCGLVTGALNLLVLGSLLSDVHERGLNRFAWVWAPASIALSAACGAAGALIGSVAGRSAASAPRSNWPTAFALVVAAGTLLLISLGGTVTGLGAGLAVPDWPNSFGYNMFLYPLSRMTGDVYFEHAHRLFGSLLGLATLTFAIYIACVERRTWVKLLAGAALIAVIVQGLLGGLRVTGRLTLSTAPEHLAPNLALAVVHGILAQLFLALIAALAVVLSHGWRTGTYNSLPDRADAEARAGWWAVAALVCQLVLGALLRHTGQNWALALHITMAVAVVGLAGWFALRAGSGGKPPVVRRLGMLVLALLAAQFVFGFGALAGLSLEDAARTSRLQALLTTLHQSTGALLLAATTALLVTRLPAPGSRPATRGFPVGEATSVSG